MSRGGRFPAAIALALLCVAAGCTRRDERADLVFINGAEPETLDPALITGQPEGRITLALFEGLTAFDEFGHPQPGTARAWDLSPDGRTYTFHLRPEARWSNGDPLTARDFLLSWERTLRPDTAADYAYMLYPIANARPYNEGAIDDFSRVGARAPDPHTLVVTLDHPTPYLLDLCAFVTLLPVHIPTTTRHGDDWIKPGNMVSNGAYTLEDWRINGRVRLRRNPHYWNRAAVDLETIDALPIDVSYTAFNFYASGQADLILDKGLAPIDLIDQLRRRPDFHAAPFLATYFLRFNVTRPPLDDPRVRLAICLAIDRERITRKITRAGEQPATSITPPGTGGHTPPRAPARDPDRARRLLADAGFPGGRRLPLLRYLYNSSDLNEYIAVELRDMLRAELGIELAPQQQEWKVYLNSMNTLDYDLCRSSWVGDYNDPNTFLDMFTTGNGNNRTGWSHPPYDALIAEAAREPDPSARLRLFHEAETILVAEHVPVCPLYHYVGIQFYDPSRFGGIHANLLDEHPLRKIFRRDRPRRNAAGEP